MNASEQGKELNFPIIDEATRSAVGTTSFFRVVPEHKRLEMGKTWLGAPYRRTHINTAAKYLMINHAFETILANRVELNTDARNIRSQRAMERLGAGWCFALSHNHTGWLCSRHRELLLHDERLAGQENSIRRLLEQ
jgi:RimJ/RimL family protein N-acetyltransferase